MEKYEKFLTYKKVYAERRAYDRERIKPSSNVFPAWTKKRRNQWEPRERNIPPDPVNTSRAALVKYRYAFESANKLVHVPILFSA